MRNVFLRSTLCAGMTLFVVGCDSGTSTSVPATDQSAAVAPQRSTAAPSAGPDLSAALTGDAPAEQPAMVSEVAAVGAGKKGRGYGGGIISEPVRAYFRTGQRIAFDIQIPKALREYKAFDPDGKGPPSHEVFMEKIIKEYGIELPELPEGESYFYDPEQEQLMVQRPER